MKILVLYDSFFGNTEKIAQEIGSALSKHGSVHVEKIGEKTALLFDDIDLLVLGSPTRAFSPSPNVKNFIKSLPENALQGVKVAVFDTRISLDDVNSKLLHFFVKLFGYASEPMLKGLEKKGATRATEPGWFYVKDSEGPLSENELEHASTWAESLIKFL
jgi:flavodoxin